MALDPSGPLTQYRQQIDQNTLDIADCATKDEVLAHFVSAGYGGIGSNGPDILPDIDSTWQNITGWDQGLIAQPVNVIQNFAAGGIQFEEVGIYNIAAKVSLTFNESNSGRELQLRTFNQSTGTPSGNIFHFFIGRNQAGTNLSFPLLAQVDTAELNDLFILQLSSPDTFTNVVNIGSVLQAFHVSEFKGAL